MYTTTYHLNDPRPLYDKMEFDSGQYVRLFVDERQEDVAEILETCRDYGIEAEEVSPEQYDHAWCVKAAVTLNTLALVSHGIAQVYWGLFSADGELLGYAIDDEQFYVFEDGKRIPEDDVFPWDEVD